MLKTTRPALRMLAFGSILYVLKRPPLRTRRNGSPGIVLRPSRLDPSMSTARREMALDHIGADVIPR
jgi:hypothetical protein